jgi:hypothetical protein
MILTDNDVLCQQKENLELQNEISSIQFSFFFIVFLKVRLFPVM